MAYLITADDFKELARLARIAIHSCDNATSMTDAEKKECAKLFAIRDIVYKWDRDKREDEITDPREDAASYINATMLTDEFQDSVKKLLDDIEELKRVAVVVRNIAQILDILVAVFRILAI